jgi:hypothetical protein
MAAISDLGHDVADLITVELHRDDGVGRYGLSDLDRYAFRSRWGVRSPIVVQGGLRMGG